MKQDEVVKIIESTAISIAASIPVLASIATGWNEYKNHIQTQNIKSILEIFYHKLNEMDSKVDQIYLESNELKALTTRACIYGKDEISEEKRKMLGQFLANSCTIELANDIIKNSILETIIKLSYFDIYLMNLLAETSKFSQNQILSGEKRYEPNYSSWTAMSETDFIKKVENHKDHEIVASLEYLNSVGVIENATARNISYNVESYVEDYLKNKKWDEIQEKRHALYNSRDNVNRVKEMSKLDEEERSFDDEYRNTNYLYEKHYMISSLGLAVLAYLKE